MNVVKRTLQRAEVEASVSSRSLSNTEVHLGKHYVDAAGKWKQLEGKLRCIMRDVRWVKIPREG